MHATTYTQPFEQTCSVTIPGTVHGFRHLQPEHVKCVDQHTWLPLTPAHIAIDPETQDVTLTFIIPESGAIYLDNPATQPPIWSEYLPGEGYYLHIAMHDPLDTMLTALFESGIPLPLPQTPDNDADIQVLIEVLQRLSARVQAQEPY